MAAAPTYNSFWDTTEQFSRRADFFKAIRAGTQVADLTGNGTDESKAVGNAANIGKLLYAPGKVLDNVGQFGSATANAIQNPSFWGFANAFRKANSIVGPFTDCAELGAKLPPHFDEGAPWFKTLKGVNGSALVISMSWNACESLSTLASGRLSETQGTKEHGKEFTKITAALLKLAKEVAYIALGTFLVLANFFAYTVPSVYFTLASVTTVVFTILGFYHENWGAPKPVTGGA